MFLLHISAGQSGVMEIFPSGDTPRTAGKQHLLRGCCHKGRRMAQTLAGQWDARPSCSIPGEGSPDVEQKCLCAGFSHGNPTGEVSPSTASVWTGGMREGQGLAAAESFGWGELQGERAQGYSQPSLQV